MATDDHDHEDLMTDALAAKTLPFPPITKAHILNCAYHNWHQKYRSITPKSRLVPLPNAFLEYLRADGIILPQANERPQRWSDDDSGVFSASEVEDVRDDDDDSDDEEDIAASWRPTHTMIREVISELGGKIVPKLNWSSPKDATWMNANTMECREPNDIYLLLKSSDFITHDLEHPFDGCVDTPDCSIEQTEIPYYLVLRKYVQFNPSVEFRCFVRGRRLLALCQRDLNHFDFLFEMDGKLRSTILEFFNLRLRDTFPDENFVFDVYVPAPHNKVWLVDINPWAPRTDPLLFSWLELLTMDDPPSLDDDEHTEEFVRLTLDDVGSAQTSSSAEPSTTPEDSESDSETDEEIWLPELRLVRKTDPEAYSFNTPRYSAHKLPKDVVDASQSGEGLREFARDWQNVLAKRQQEDAEAGQSDSD